MADNVNILITEKDIEMLKKAKAEREKLDLEEVAEKKWKPLESVLDLMIFVGIVCLAIFSILALLGFIYAVITGFPLSDIWIILAIACFILLIGIIVLFLMITRAGRWFKFGMDLSRRKGEGIIKFPEAGGINFAIEKRARIKYYKPGDKQSRYFTTSKGYLEPSTGSTFRTVRENSITDFDVNEESTTEFDELAPLISNRLEQEWDAGVNWNKARQDLLTMLVIIAMIAAVGAAIMSIGNLYLTYDNFNKTDKKMDAMVGNIEAITKTIEKNTQANQVKQNAEGVVVE